MQQAVEGHAGGDAALAVHLVVEAAEVFRRVLVEGVGDASGAGGEAGGGDVAQEGNREHQGLSGRGVAIGRDGGGLGFPGGGGDAGGGAEQCGGESDLPLGGAQIQGGAGAGGQATGDAGAV